MGDVATLTLTDFLLARIDEDEATARAAGIPAHDGYKPHGELMAWRYVPGDEVEFDYDDPGPYPSKFYVTCDSEGLTPAVEPSEGEHIARWDPARVLAECEMKRQIMALHGNDDNDYRCQSGNYTYSPCRTLRLLALPYTDHPDYREEWRP